MPIQKYPYHDWDINAVLFERKRNNCALVLSHLEKYAVVQMCGIQEIVFVDFSLANSIEYFESYTGADQTEGLLTDKLFDIFFKGANKEKWIKDAVRDIAEMKNTFLFIASNFECSIRAICQSIIDSGPLSHDDLQKIVSNYIV